MRVIVVGLTLAIILMVGVGCRSSIVPGTYSGKFSWDHGLRSADLKLTSDQHRTLDLRKKEIGKQVEAILQDQIKRANLSAANGVVTISVVGVSPFLVNLQRLEIQSPNFAELLSYINAGNIALIKRFIDVHGNPNQRDLPSERTALYYAAAGCKVGALDALFAAKSDPNIPDFEGDSPLIAAVTANCIQAASQLISHGANINDTNEVGQTALSRAVKLGHTPIVSLLLRNGAKVHPLSYNSTGCQTFSSG